MPSCDQQELRTSEILTRLADGESERLSVEQIMETIGDRSFGLLIFILGAPNCIPMPPPVATLSAVLLLVLAPQIGIGRKSPSLPAFILSKSMARRDVRRAIEKTTPVLAWLEKYSSERFQLGAGRLGSVFVSVIVAVLAVGMLTSVPVLGQMPWGVAVCLLGLGLVERDGLLIACSIIMAIIGGAISAGVVYAAALGAHGMS